MRPTISRVPRTVNRLTGLLPLTLILVGILMWSLSPVYAHGEIIEATPNEAKSGDEVTISGEEFPPGEEVELYLESVRGSLPLGHVEADDSGIFSLTISISESISPGSYQLVAATEDDNITLDFTVLEGATESRAEGGTTLVFQRSTSEVTAIGLITAALILGGVVLVLTGTRQHART